MYFYQYYFTALYVLACVAYRWNGAPVPDALRTAGVWITWAFLAYAVYLALRVIVNCLRLTAQGQMTRESRTKGILLATLHFLPSMLITAFMLTFIC